MIYLFNRDKVAVKAIDYDDFNTLIQTEVVNGMIDLTSEIRLMKVLKGDRKPTNVKKLFDDIEFIGHFDYKKDFQMYRLIKPSVDNSTLGFYSVHIFHDEGQAKAVIHDRRWRDSQAHTVLRDTYAYIGWELTDYDSTKVLHHNAFRQTPAQVRAEVIEKYGVEIEPYLEFDGKRITRKCFRMKKKIGQETHDRFDYGSDLLDITREEDKGDIYTAVIPRGNGEEGIANSKIEIDTIAWSKANGDPVDKPLGQNWLEVPTATQQYGYVEGGAVSPRTIVMDFETDDVPELAQLAWEWINENCVPKSLMETVVHTVGRNYGLGDSIGIVYKEADIIKKARIQKAERNLKRSILTKFQIGDYDYFIKNTVTRQYRKKLNDVEQSTNKSVEVLNDRFNNKYDDAVKRIDDSANAVKDYAEAQIIAKEQEYKESWDIRDKALNDSIEKLAGGSLDGIQTNVTELYTDMLKKLEQADLQPLESRLEASEKGIEGVFTNLGQLSGARNMIEKKNLFEYGGYTYISVLDIKAGRYILSVQNPIYKGLFTLAGEYVIDKKVISIPSQAFDEPIIFNFDIDIPNLTLYLNSSLADFEKAKIQLERGTEMTEWSPALADVGNVAELSSRITFNEEKLETTFTKVGTHESEIGTLKQTASGLETTFLNYEQDTDGEISTMKQTASSISQSVNSMSNKVDSLEGWRADKGALFDMTADKVQQSVWKQDIDAIEMGVENLIPNSDIINWKSSTVPSEWKYATGAGEIWSGRQNSEYILVRANYLEIKNNTTYGIATPILTRDVIEGEEYTLVFNNFDYGDFPYDNMYLLDEDGTSNQSLGTPSHDKFVRKWTSSNSSKNVERLILTVIPKFSGRARISFAKRIEAGEQAMFYINEPQFVKGNKAPMSFSPSPLDFLNQTDFILQSDGFFLGGKYVGGGHYSTAIVGDAGGLKLLSDNIDVHGNLNVKGDVDAWSVSAVTANLGRVFANTGEFGFIKGKHVEFDSAFIKDFVGKSAFIDNAQIKAANIRDLNTISLTAEQVKVGFNKVGSNIQLSNSGLETLSGGTVTSRLHAQGHTFYKDNLNIGYIGTIPWVNDNNYRGLSFNMTKQADFMAWTHDDNNDGTYDSKLMWHAKGTSKGDKGFTFLDNVRIDNPLDVRHDISSTRKVKAGSRAYIESSANGARLAASNNVWLYVNENGQVGVSINGTAYAIYNP